MCALHTVTSYNNASTITAKFITHKKFDTRLSNFP